MTKGGEAGDQDRGPGPAPVALEPEMPLGNALEVLWYRRWTVVGVLVLCVAAGLLYLAKAVPIYRSSSRIYVEKEGPKIISGEEVLSMTESKNFLYTQAEVITSTPILSAALEKLDTGRMLVFARVDNTAVFLKKTLEARVGKQDEILTVAFDSPYPAEAPQIVNAVVDAYITYHARKKQSTAAVLLKILREELERREKELKEKLQAIVDCNKESGVAALRGDRGNITIQQLSHLAVALSEAQLEAVDARATYEAIREAQDDTEVVRQLVQAGYRSQYQGYSTENRFAQVRQELDRVRRDLSGKLSVAEEELANLAAAFTDSVPAVRAAMSRVERLREELRQLETERAALEKERKAELKTFVGAWRAAAHQRSIVASEKITELEKLVAEQRLLAQDAAVKDAEYALLQSDIEQTTRACDLLRVRIEELNLTEDTGALNISVLEVAKVEDEPIHPRKALTMAMVLFFGGGLGAGLAMLREWLDHRLRSIEEVAMVLRAPILGVVQHLADSEADGNTGRWVHEKPMSSFSEAFRTIRTAVYFGLPRERSKTLLVTSATPQEGKSTIACNLGIAMAQAGQRILLLDADFRKPRQQEILGLEGKIGLSNVLIGRATLKEAIQPTDIPGLSLLACGPRPLNPAEVLNSEAFASILEKLKKSFHRVIIDSPPVLGLADARILSALADATILVVLAEKTTRKAVEAARDALASVGKGILGAVVNNTLVRGSRYGYYGSYGYAGYHDEGNGKSDQKGGPKQRGRAVRMKPDAE